MLTQIYKCESCKKEYIILDDHSSYCIKCGSSNVKVTSRNYNYELYNKKTGFLVG